MEQIENNDLLRVIKQCDSETIRAMLERGMDTNMRILGAYLKSDKERHDAQKLLTDDAGETLLMIASTYGCMPIVQELVAAGADINLFSTSTTSALVNATVNHHKAIVEFLLENGASINGAAQGGDTALIAAVCAESHEMVKLLLEKGANPDVRASDGATALMLAIESKVDDIAEMLIDAGANIAWGDDFGNSALSLARKYRRIRIVYLLESLS